MTMAHETAPPTIKLDWSRLLGFDQAVQSCDEDAAKRLNDPRLIKLGAKFGCKKGIRLLEIGNVDRAP
jgi:hypothetical protein